MTNTPGDGQPPHDPYTQRPSENPGSPGFSGSSDGSGGSSSPGSSAYGEQPPYAQPSYGNEPQQQQYGQEPYGQGQHGQEPYGQAQYGQGQYGQGQYGQGQYGQGQYGQEQYPQYGAQPGYGGGYPGAPVPTEGKAVAAMIVGIVSLVLACGYGIGLLGSPVALFLGRSSMKAIDASQGRLGGRGMAQAGFILGIVGTVLLVLVLIGAAVLITTLASTNSFTSP